MARWGDLEDYDRLLVKRVQPWLLFNYHILLAEVSPGRTDDEGEEALRRAPKPRGLLWRERL